MKIACDLFTSSIKFQVITKKIIRKLKKNFKDIELISIDSKKFKKNKKKIEIYWGNRINLDTINELPNLKWIHYGSTGVNETILRSTKSKNILITNSRRMFDEAVSATVMSFIFTLASILIISKLLIDNISSNISNDSLLYSFLGFF